MSHGDDENRDVLNKIPNPNKPPTIIGYQKDVDYKDASFACQVIILLDIDKYYNNVETCKLMEPLGPWATPSKRNGAIE